MTKQQDLGINKNLIATLNYHICNNTAEIETVETSLNIAKMQQNVPNPGKYQH